MLCKVILIGKEWSHPSKLQDTLAAIHDSNFVSRQQVLSELLIVCSVTGTVASGVGSIEGIDRFLAQGFCQFLQCRRLRASKEDLAVAVADDGIGVVFINRFEL